MQYLITTYWMWFVVALLVGGVVGYWLRWRLGAQGGSSHGVRWGAVAFLIGLVVAVLNWLPQRPGLYLETLLLLSFWYAAGGWLGALLRGVTSATGSTSVVLAGNAAPDSAALARRARAVVKSAQEEAVASAGTIEDARLAVEAKATEVTRIATAAKAADDERIAAAAKVAEAARLATAAKAVEEARLGIEAKAAEVTRIAAAARAAEGARIAAGAKAGEEARVATAKAVEDARVASEAKAAEVTRIAAAAKAVEDARLAAEAKAAEALRSVAAAKAAEEARLAAEVKTAEEARLAAAAKAQDRAEEEARLAVEAKAVEEARVVVAARAAVEARRTAGPKTAKKARTATAAKADEDARLAAEARVAEGAREAAAKVAHDPGPAATAAAAEAGTSHPGKRPKGIAVPAEGEADDLKWIKGIGPRNEKACNALGIYQFRQIAGWTPDEAIWLGHHMAFPGRIERERWIAQAGLLASGGETEHAKAVKSGGLAVDDTADAPLDQASVETLARSLPQQAASVDGEDTHAGRRPYGLANALGEPDNLKKIRGIGPQNERRLHGLGIWHFAQIAAWSEDNVKWVGSYLAFAGRIDREKWIAQARDLAAGRDPGISRPAPAGKVAKDDGASR